MPSTSLSMFCACSSAHHKCDVSIALDSCTSNKNEKEKNWTVILFFCFVLFFNSLGFRVRILIKAKNILKLEFTLVLPPLHIFPATLNSQLTQPSQFKARILGRPNWTCADVCHYVNIYLHVDLPLVQFNRASLEAVLWLLPPPPLLPRSHMELHAGRGDAPACARSNIGRRHVKYKR